jgi:hypothetical protein
MLTNSYPNRVSLIFSACVCAAILCLPWPDARGPSVARSIWLTFRDLNVNAATTLRRYQAFTSDLRTPGSGEDVLPWQVQQALTIVRGRGRAVKRYDLSPSLRADDWVFQQLIVALWPRHLEQGATARFVLNRDPLDPACTLIDRQQDVSLVYCP